MSHGTSPYESEGFYEPDREPDRPASAEDLRIDARRNWERDFAAWNEERVVIVVEMVWQSTEFTRLPLRETLWWRYDHNRTVAALLKEAQAESEPWGSALTTLEHGVLITCDQPFADEAMALAWRIMDAFDQRAEHEKGLLYRSRIGMAVGDVVRLPSEVIDGGDVQGPAVDSAMRLVRDSGMPGQILLDEGAHDAISIRRVQAIVHDTADRVTVAFDPASGTAQRPLGTSQKVMVWQLLWREDRAPIVNRRVLTAEVLQIQKAALEVLTRVNDLNRLYRAAVAGRSMDRIIAFYDDMKALGDPEDEIGSLVATWERATETSDEMQLEAAYQRVIETHRAATDALGGTESARDEGETPFEEALRKVRDGWSAFEKASTKLLIRTQTRVDRLYSDE